MDKQHKVFVILANDERPDSIVQAVIPAANLDEAIERFVDGSPANHEDFKLGDLSADEHEMWQIETVDYDDCHRNLHRITEEVRIVTDHIIEYETQGDTDKSLTLAKQALDAKTKIMDGIAALHQIMNRS